MKGGLIPKIGEYLRYPALGILVPSLRILGNLLSGVFLITQGLQNNKFLLSNRVHTNHYCLY